MIFIWMFAWLILRIVWRFTVESYVATKGEEEEEKEEKSGAKTRQDRYTFCVAVFAVIASNKVLFLFTLLPFSLFFPLFIFSLHFDTPILLYPLFNYICIANGVLFSQLFVLLTTSTDQLNQNISEKNIYSITYKEKITTTPFENKTIRNHLFAKKNRHRN